MNQVSGRKTRSNQRNLMNSRSCWRGVKKNMAGSSAGREEEEKMLVKPDCGFRNLETSLSFGSRGLRSSGPSLSRDSGSV